MSEFPQDIINSVVDELGSLGSKKLLSTVALSARCFLHPAQSYLFRTINLTQSHPQDWDTFCAILHHSPTIKSHVRSISFGNIPGNPHDCVDWGYYERPMCKIPEINSTVALLTGLQAIHFNYDGRDHQDDWKNVLTECRGSPVSPFWCSTSITTLSLGSLWNVPVGLINAILKMSQLTTLMIWEVSLLKDAQFFGASQLVNLRTFGLIFDRRTPPNMKKLQDLIVRSSSRKLRKIMVSQCEYSVKDSNVGVKNLPKLKILSIYATDHVYFAMRQILFEIIESQRTTVEIIEISSLEYYIFYGSSFEKERRFWDEFDEILQNDAFSSLKEIRLLFNFRSQWDRSHSVETCEENSCPNCSIDQVASKFRSVLPQTVERGVQVTSGLTFGWEGLLSMR